ncbi:streptococcal hemagglutinin-like [Lepisosteus oculatus]|uniref:streptococcal hemagglutinin-like n=1 Tax=Lepisosteus oculatus TaxID=7918 RepID=UPI003715D41D
MRQWWAEQVSTLEWIRLLCIRNLSDHTRPRSGSECESPSRLEAHWIFLQAPCEGPGQRLCLCVTDPAEPESGATPRAAATACLWTRSAATTAARAAAVSGRVVSRCSDRRGAPELAGGSPASGLRPAAGTRPGARGRCPLGSLGSLGSQTDGQSRAGRHAPRALIPLRAQTRGRWRGESILRQRCACGGDGGTPLPLCASYISLSPLSRSVSPVSLSPLAPFLLYHCLLSSLCLLYYGVSSLSSQCPVPLSLSSQCPASLSLSSQCPVPLSLSSQCPASLSLSTQCPVSLSLSVCPHSPVSLSLFLLYHTVSSLSSQCPVSLSVLTVPSPSLSVLTVPSLSLCPHSAQSLSLCPHSAQSLSLCPHSAQPLSLCPHSAQSLSVPLSSQCPVPLSLSLQCPVPLSLCPHSAQSLSLGPHSVRSLCPSAHTGVRPACRSGSQVSGSHLTDPPAPQC